MVPHCEDSQDKRLDIGWYCWMNSKKDHPGLLQRNRTLQRDLPEVFVESKNDASFYLRTIQQSFITIRDTVGSSPEHIMP